MTCALMFVAGAVCGALGLLTLALCAAAGRADDAREGRS